MKRSEVIMSFSPVHHTGQSTITNFVALELARQNNLVLVIELDRFCASCNQLHKRTSMGQESLKAVLEKPNLFSKHTIRSPHSNNLYYICQPPQAGIADMVTYSKENIDELIEIARQGFDYIFLDVPSGIEEASVVRIFGKEFTETIDKVLMTASDDLRTLLMLKNVDSFLALLKDTTYKTTLVLNRSSFIYNDYIEDGLKELNKFKVENFLNIVDLPFLTEIVNSGELLSLGTSKRAEEFLLNIKQIAEIIANNISGVGIKLDKQETKVGKHLHESKIGIGKKTKRDVVEETLTYKNLEDKVLGSTKEELKRDSILEGTTADSKRKNKGKDKTKTKGKGFFGFGKKKDTQPDQDLHDISDLPNTPHIPDSAEPDIQELDLTQEPEIHDIDLGDGGNDNV